MKNYLPSSRCARCLKVPRQLVNREEQGILIAQTNGIITMIDESNYTVRSKSGYNTEIRNIIRKWLDRCDQLRRLNFSSNYMINYNIKSASRSGFRPISLGKLKIENTYLYKMLA